MKCETCNGEVIFATTIMGLPIVLDAQPNPSGSFISGADRHAHMVPPQTPGVRFASHYATCRANREAVFQRQARMKAARS